MLWPLVTSPPGVWRKYRQELRESFVLRDLATFGRAIDFLHHDRLFALYPQVVSALMEDLYRSDGTPKRKIARLARLATKGRVPVRQLLADLFAAGRGYL